MIRSTRILLIDPRHPEPDRIAEAAKILREGGLVAFPTETVYGLGANALSTEAVEGIFRAKGRPTTNPLIVHLASLQQWSSVAAEFPEAARQLADAFWPGPLTLVLPKSAAIPLIVTAGGPTVAVRIPRHPVAFALLEAVGLPIAAPSANRSTELSPTRAEHVFESLGGRIDLILDAGPTTAGIESTVVDVTTHPPRLLRPGPIAPSELEAYLGPMLLPGQMVPTAEEPIRSPGLSARHYAPRTPLELVDDVECAAARFPGNVGELWAIVARAEEVPELPQGIRIVTMPNDSAGFASRLYDVLHELDHAGLERILVIAPPPNEEWLAVRDRLRRAATDHG